MLCMGLRSYDGVEHFMSQSWNSSGVLGFQHQNALVLWGLQNAPVYVVPSNNR